MLLMSGNSCGVSEGYLPRRLTVIDTYWSRRFWRFGQPRPMAGGFERRKQRPLRRFVI
jgi:hypothetical protein